GTRWRASPVNSSTSTTSPKSGAKGSRKAGAARLHTLRLSRKLRPAAVQGAGCGFSPTRVHPGSQKQLQPRPALPQLRSGFRKFGCGPTALPPGLRTSAGSAPKSTTAEWQPGFSWIEPRVGWKEHALYLLQNTVL